MPIRKVVDHNSDQNNETNGHKMICINDFIF